MRRAVGTCVCVAAGRSVYSLSMVINVTAPDVDALPELPHSC